MTQVELARLLGVSPQTVNKILHSTNVQSGTLEHICEVMHMPITFFYEGDAVRQKEDEPKGQEEKTSNNVEYKPVINVSATAPKEDEKVFDDNVAKFWETKRIGEKVRGLLKSQHKKLSVLCHYVGMTDAGLRMAFNRDSCNVKVLLKMAEFFNVPVTYFLPEDRHAKAETEKDREIQYLKGQLKAYENTLAIMLQGMKGTENVDMFAIRTANE